MVDSNRACRRFQLKNFQIDEVNVHSDVYDLDIDALPVVELFTFSPSCKGYSLNGNFQGEKHAEGETGWVAIAYINRHRPLMFALEQVRHILKFPIWKKILRAIRRMCCYEFTHDLLGGASHGGIPQRRIRLYGWGIQRLVSTGLVVPRPLPPGMLLSLSDLLGIDEIGTADDFPTDNVGHPNLLESYSRTAHLDPMNNLFVFDIYGTKPHMYVQGVFPTITAARASAKGYFLSSLMRFTKHSELARMMGMNPQKLNGQDISKRQQGLMLGNSIVVPVGCRVVHSLLRALDR